MASARKERISPEDYRKVLSGLEIVRIDVDEFAGKVLDRDGLYAGDRKRVVHLKEKSYFEARDGKEATIWHSYRLEVTTGGADSPQKLMTLAVTFRVQYASKEPFTTEFFDEFRKLSLRIQTAPFARAWIHDHCLRMGVPPLILPLVRAG